MIAGASRGLGFAVARALAAEGAVVSIASRDAAAASGAARRLERETGTSAFGTDADVRSAEAIRRWHAETVRRFGGVDLLFTNSGGPPLGAFRSLDDTAWQQGFELLVLSVIRMIRTVVPSMVERGRGSILLSTSSSVKEPIPNLTLSSVLRASVAALAKTLANELAPDGIRVNHLIPGRIATDRLRELDEATASLAGVPLPDQQARAIAAIPLGRYGLPAEFGLAAAFLLSDASRYTTGATFQVDGGLIRSVL